MKISYHENGENYDMPEKVIQTHYISNLIYSPN